MSISLLYNNRTLFEIDSAENKVCKMVELLVWSMTFCVKERGRGRYASLKLVSSWLKAAKYRVWLVVLL